jgi:hypothetical protein
MRARTASHWMDTQRAAVRARPGRYREAAELWEQVIPAPPASSRRDIGGYQARHAQALTGAARAGRHRRLVSRTAPVISATRPSLPAPAPGSVRAAGRAHTGMHARLGGARQAWTGRQRTRPWPSAETPTVRTNR